MEGAAQGTPILPRPGDVLTFWGIPVSIAATLDDVLDAAEALDHDSRVELVSVLSKRLAESSRERFSERVDQGLADFAAGRYEVMSAADIVAEAMP